MTLAEDQNMVQQFMPDAANESLAYGVDFRHFHWRMDHNHIDASTLGNALELVAKLAAIVADKKARPRPKRRDFAQLLAHPHVAR